MTFSGLTDLRFQYLVAHVYPCQQQRCVSDSLLAILFTRWPSTTDLRSHQLLNIATYHFVTSLKTVCDLQELILIHTLAANLRRTPCGLLLRTASKKAGEAKMHPPGIEPGRVSTPLRKLPRRFQSALRLASANSEVGSGGHAAAFSTYQPEHQVCATLQTPSLVQPMFE